MLISREAWQRVGLFDERLDSRHEDLDFCWRARLAGFHVLMTPLARARHRDASAAGERPAERHRRTERYYEERAAIVAMLKNYGLPSLLWVLPLAILLGVVRLVYLVLTRRFEGALDLLAAWGWNIVHLPGDDLPSGAGAIRAQGPDRQFRRFMESAGVRLPRWFTAAGQIFEEQREIEEQDEDASAGRRLRDRTASLVGLTSRRRRARSSARWWRRSRCGPPRSRAAARRSASAVPRLVARILRRARVRLPDDRPRRDARGESRRSGRWARSRGSRSRARLSPRRCCWRAGRSSPRSCCTARWRGSPAVRARRSRAPSPTGCPPWCSGGSRRVASGSLVALCVLPVLLERLEVAFGRGDLPDGRWRFIAGLAVTLAVGIAFMPGVALAAAVLVVVQLALRLRARRGVGDRGRGVRRGRRAPVPVRAHYDRRRRRRSRLADRHHGPRGAGVGSRSAEGRARGGSPRSSRSPRCSRSRWSAPSTAGSRTAPCSRRSPASRSRGLVRGLPPRVGGERTDLPRARRGRRGVGRRPGALVGALGLGRESFGFRQIGTALLAAVLGAGIAAPVRRRRWSAVGRWGARKRLPPAWAVVSSSAKGEFRVIWLGADTGRAFVAPGGDPEGVVPNGASSLRFGLTGRDGHPRDGHGQRAHRFR